MHTTSVSLLKRLRQSPDSKHWGEFERLYQPWLGKNLLHLVPPGEVEDVLQEVLLVLLRQLPQFQHNGQKGAFRRWLRLIVVHRVQEYRKARDRAPQLGQEYQRRCAELADDRSGLSELWDREHDRHVVEQLLIRIAGDFEIGTWQAFRAFVLENRSAAEVAHSLGISEGAVWTAKSRVLRRLRQLAEEWID